MSSLRMQHRHEASKRLRRKVVTLNLVSLTDFFTILLVFLLVHTSAPELLERMPDIKPPDSTSQQLPDKRVLIQVSTDDVVVEGRVVASVQDLTKDTTQVVPALAQALREESARLGAMPEGGRSVTIMGDKTIPYAVLKRIMLTCQANDFSKIALAVNKLDVKPSNDAVAAAHASAGATGGAS